MAGASKFTNRDRLQRKFKAIPPAVRKALLSQNNANGDELVETIRGFMSSPQSGDLRASVRNQDVSDGDRISQRVEAGGEKTTKPVRKGATATYDYALAQEYSTVDMPANPAFWPAWRLKRRRFKSRMSRAAKKAIQGAVQ